jgi:hypothetical protein
MKVVDSELKNLSHSHVWLSGIGFGEKIEKLTKPPSYHYPSSPYFPKLVQNLEEIYVNNHIPYPTPHFPISKHHFRVVLVSICFMF